MKFMMLMIPAVYQGGKKLDPGFVPDPKKVEQMTQFNQEMGKALKILDLNGLHPQAKGARVAFARGKPNCDRRPVHRSQGSAGWILAGRGRFKRGSREMGEEMSSRGRGYH